MTVKWVNLEITHEDIAVQLKANGQAGDLTQVLEVANKILDNIQNHDIKRELIGRAIKDIGVINLAKLAMPSGRVITCSNLICSAAVEPPEGHEGWFFCEACQNNWRQYQDNPSGTEGGKPCAPADHPRKNEAGE